MVAAFFSSNNVIERLVYLLFCIFCFLIFCCCIYLATKSQYFCCSTKPLSAHITTLIIIWRRRWNTFGQWRSDPNPKSTEPSWHCLNEFRIFNCLFPIIVRLSQAWTAEIYLSDESLRRGQNTSAFYLIQHNTFHLTTLSLLNSNSPCKEINTVSKIVRCINRRGEANNTDRPRDRRQAFKDHRPAKLFPYFSC